MPESLGRAVLHLATNDKALKAGLKTARKAVGQFGKSMTALGKDLSTKVTLPIVAFGGFALKASGDFEKGMNQVAAVSGATQGQLKDLTAQAKELGATTQFSASEAADGMGFLAQAGFEANDILKAMPKALQLAAAAQLDLGQTSDIVSNILAGYRLEVNDLTRVNDVLVKAFTSSNTNLQQLGEAMKFAGPVASAAGVQFEEAAAALGIMGNAGIQASMAGTSLRGAISRILNPSKEAANRMKELGLNFTDANGRLLPLSELIRQLEPLADDAGLFMELFGQRAGPAMAALVAEGSAKLSELTKTLENSGGTAEKIAKVQMQGFNGAMKELKSAFEALQIAIGESGLLEFGASLARRLADVIRQLSKSNPGLLKMGVVIAGIAAAIGPALVIIGSLTTAISAAIPVITAIGTALVSVFTGPAAPFILFAGVVTHWIVNWEKLKADTLSIIDFLIEGIKNKFNQMLDGVKNIAGRTKDAVVSKFKEMFDKIVGNSIVPEMRDLVEGEFQLMGNNMIFVAKESTDKVKSLFGEMSNEMGRITGEMALQLLNGTATIEKFTLAAGRAIAKALALRAASKLGGFGGGLLSAFAGAFAGGGTIPPGSFGLVGEQGPELAFAGSRPLNIQPMGSGAGGISVNQNFNVTGLDFSSDSNIRRMMTGFAAKMKAGAVEALNLAKATDDKARGQARRAT